MAFCIQLACTCIWKCVDESRHVSMISMERIIQTCTSAYEQMHVMRLQINAGIKSMLATFFMRKRLRAN